MSDKKVEGEPAAEVDEVVRTSTRVAKYPVVLGTVLALLGGGGGVAGMVGVGAKVDALTAKVDKLAEQVQAMRDESTVARILMETQKAQLADHESRLRSLERTERTGGK